MDWLKKAAGWLGNAAYQGAKLIPGVGTSIRAYEDLARRTNQARQQLQQRQPQRQLPPPVAPRLNYQAAMQALHTLNNAPKSGYGVTVGQIARQVPQAITQTPGAIAGGIKVGANFVAPNTIKLAQQASNTAQATGMRLGNIGTLLGGHQIDPGRQARINQLESKGFVPQNVLSGKASVPQFAGAIFKTGAPVGLEVANFATGMNTAGMGLRQAAPALIKQGAAFGVGQTAQNLALGPGTFNDRLKNLPKDAALNIAGNVGGQFLGYGLGRAGSALASKLHGPVSTGASLLPTAAAGKLKRPVANNVSKLDGLPDSALHERNYISNLQAAQGEGAMLPKNLSPSKKAQLLADFQASQQRVGTVQTINGKKVFAPTFQPGEGTGKLGRINQNFNPPDAQGRFTPNQTDGMKRVISDRELAIYNKTGKLPANQEGYTNVIKPGELKNIKGMPDSKKYLVTFRDGLKIDSESGPQAAVKGGIDRKYISQIEPYVPTTKRYNDLVPKDYLNPQDKKIGKALGMSDSQMLEAKGVTKAGLSAQEMAQVRKLGYTPEDITYLSATQLKQAVKNKIPVSEGLNQLNASENFANPVVPGLKQRGFVNTLQNDFGVPSDLTNVLPAGYKPVGNAATFAKAKSVVDSDPKILSKLMSKPKETITATDQAQLQILLRRAVENDDLKTAQRVATKLDVNAREAGRTVQIMAAWKKTTPEGALSEAYKVVEEAQKKFPGKNIELTPEKAATIRQLANEIQKYGVGTRERDVASAMLEKEIAGIVPASVGRKLSTVQTMSQLLNPKTAIRNLGGNTVFGGLENISTTIGAGVDKTIGKVTKQRSLTVPSYMTQIKGFIKGGKYGLEDTKLGIKTSGASGQYDIRPDVFKNGILKKLEHAVGYELSVPDKAFYQAAFDDSLRNQMKAMGKTKPDVALVDTANREALYRTFQNNSTIAETLSKIKGGMNKLGISNGDFGLGDFILKYPKTPGNILASGLDYAGGGIIKGGKALYQGARQGGLTQQAQREASMNIGRGLTGLGLVGGGYGLARAGAVTADPNKDKDVANLEKGAGQGPFNINLSGLGRLINGGDAGVKQGDLNANYDWLQPASLPFTIGANVGTKQSAKDQGANLIDALNAGINTVTDQPVLQGLGKLFSSLVGQRPNPTQGIQNAVQGAPGSFVPSLLNQIGQLTDKSARNTYSPNYWEGMLNQAKTRVPGLRTSLQPRVDTFGNVQKTYEDNNVFNVFLNPAFTKHYNLTPEAKLVLDVNSNTGETTQFPRVAPYNTQVNGQKHELTSEELRKFQEFTGTKTQDAYARMVNDPAFQKLSDTDKAKRMSDVLTDVAAAAKIAVLGDIPKDRPSKNVQQLIQGGEARYSAKTVQSGGSTTASNPRERYQNAVDKYNQDKADGSISDIKDISAQQTLNRLKVQSDYSQDVVDLYSLPKAKIDAYLKKSPKGGDLFNQLIQMDDAIVAAGGNSKFRDSKGVVRITPRPKKGKKGRKVKIARAKLPARSGTGRKIARVSAGRAPKIKFASAPRSSKTAKIKVG